MELNALDVRNKAKITILSTLFNIVLAFLAIAIKQEIEIKAVKIRKEEIKAFLFTKSIINRKC